MSATASRWRLPVGCVALGGAVMVVGSLRQSADALPVAEAAVAPVPASAPAVAPESQIVVNGAEVYHEHCATCHMGDGGGVPNFQPPISGSPVVAAGRDRVEAVIRAGSAALQDRANSMGWQMPPFGFLTDAEIAALVDYVSETFGPVAKE